MPQHKDQKRVQDALLPFVMDRVLSEDPAAVRDCTVLNRALIQGPDPLFLMETCPEAFEALCDHLNLPVEQGRDAIEKAHWQGPGVLLLDRGLPPKIEPTDHIPVEWAREALWLILASMSDCTEQGYGGEISIVERLRRVATATSSMTMTTASLEAEDGMAPFRIAIEEMQKFVDTTSFTEDANGIPLTDVDHGFYVGYKRGFKAVAVKAGTLTFYGTTPDTTLEAQGITVDKSISPSFGIVFPK